MGHIVAIMMLLAGMLMFSGGPVLAAPAALESLSAQVSDARSSVQSLREEGRAVGKRVTSMTSRLAGMRARLEAQQQKMAKMQAQLKGINALIGKVSGIKVATAPATPALKVPPVANAATPNTIAAVPAPANVTQALVQAPPAPGLASAAKADASATGAPETGSGSAAAPLVQSTPTPVNTSAPAVVQAAAAVPVAPTAPAAPVVSAVPQPAESWLPDLGGFGLIAAGWLALVAVGSAIVIALRRRGKFGKRGRGKDRDAELREQVSRKAAENLSGRSAPKAASFAAAAGNEMHGGDARTLEAQPVPDGVAAAVRDSEIYVAYGETDAARDVLKKALAEHPGHVLLQSRLADLGATAGAPVARNDGDQPLADDDISFELEPLDSEDASNIVPFKRAM